MSRKSKSIARVPSKSPTQDFYQAIAKPKTPRRNWFNSLAADIQEVLLDIRDRVNTGTIERSINDLHRIAKETLGIRASAEQFRRFIRSS